MIMNNNLTPDASDQGEHAADNKFWYAVYIRSRHEKLVAKQLSAKKVQYYLPLLETTKKWSDRYKLIAEPLFPGYLFVNILSNDRVAVLETRGVVELVGTNGKPSPVPDNQIAAIRTALNSNLKLDPYPYLKVGSEVYVTRGPLKGCQGILVEKNRKHRLVLSIHLIGRSMAVAIQAADVKPL